MSSNTENTEAKLAAYIDGQLDAAERAQIEQYLQSNPEHQKLLADMMAQRAVLRSLPREKAPADIYDSLQAQLERSILLDDSAAAAPVVIRHSRRSQIFGIAAILVLSIGLCGVLYFALPSSSKRNAIEVAAVKQLETPPAAATDEAEGGRKAGEADKVASAQTGTALAEAPATAEPKSSVASNARPISPTAEAVKEQQGGALNDEVKVVEGTLRPNQMVVLVSSADPSKASRQVASYLESNNIRWETVNGVTDQAAPGGLKSMRQAIQSTTLADNGSQAIGGGELNGALLGKRVDQSASETRVQAEQKLAVLRDKETLSPAQQRAIDKYFVGMAQSPERPRNLIIARGMTREQAAQLTDTLSSEATSQRARLILDAPVWVKAAESKFESQNVSLKLSDVNKVLAATAPAGEAVTAAPEVTQAAPSAPAAAAAATQDRGAAPAEELKKDNAGKTYAFSTTQTVIGGVSGGVTTKASAPTTRPEEAGVDVVILVEDQAAATTTTAPATQSAPASQPAAQPTE